MSTMVESLKEVPLFADLAGRDLKRVADSMKEMSFAPGQEVVAQGKSGVGFFVILEGSARVSQRGEDRGLLTAGDYFGEMALIDEGIRSATITAVTDLTCYGMTPWEFKPFVDEHPEVAWTLLQNMTRRLREAQSD